MGLQTISSEDVDIAYDTIGDAGMSRCGEMRSDGKNIYALFKAAETLDLEEFVFITAYSLVDISVSKCSIDGEHVVGAPCVAAASGKYLWVLVRGTTDGTQTAFEVGGIAIGVLCGVYFGGNFGSSASGIKTLINLTTIPGSVITPGAVHIVR